RPSTVWDGRFALRPSVGAVFQQFIQILLDVRRFPCQEIGDSRSEYRVFYPVCRVGHHRHHASRQFVLALSASFEHFYAMRDAVLHTLEVAGFEVQTGDMLRASPVTTIESVSMTDVERSGNSLPPAFGNDDDQGRRHTVEDAFETVQV